MSKNRIPIDFNFEGRKYEGYINPMQIDVKAHLPRLFHVMLNTVDYGYIRYMDKKWALDIDKPQPFANLIGETISAWYEK